jgi:hypothetical protein
MPDGLQIEITRKDNILGSAIYTGFPMNITREDDEIAVYPLNVLSIKIIQSKETFK